MKTILKALMIILILNILTQTSIIAATWNIGGMGTTTKMYKNKTWSGNGTCGTNQKVQVVISTSGDFKATDIYILYAGNKYYNNSWLTCTSGNYNLTTYWSTPSNAPCGGTGKVSISFKSSMGTLYTGVGAIFIATPALTGNTDFCTGTHNTFSLIFPAGNTNSIISVSKSGWLINSQASPVAITGNQFTITPPSFSDAATLTISGDDYCISIVKTLKNAMSIPGNPSNLTYLPINSESCYYNVFTPIIVDANSYEWADNSAFDFLNTTTTNYTQFASNSDFEQGTSWQIWVRARNGCGISTNSYAQTLDFPPLSNCLPSRPEPLFKNAEGFESTQKTSKADSFNAYFVKGSELLHIELPSNLNSAEVSCFSFDGNLIDRFNVTSNISEINIGNLSHNKLLIISIKVGEQRFVKKIAL